MVGSWRAPWTRAVAVVTFGVCLAAALVRTGNEKSEAAVAGNERPGKKLLEWGWDEPDTQYIRRHIVSMERLPFDGVVFHANSARSGNLTWEIWGKRAFTLAEFQTAIDDLTATKFQRFTERFLRVNVTPGDIDWFDDRQWATVAANFAVAAAVARRGGCCGFVFDVEQYQAQPFDYHRQTHANSRTFGEYQAKVRQRGGEWIRAINRAFPDVTILLTFAYAIAQPHGSREQRSAVKYGLLAAFLDGAVEACTEGTTFVDAWEPSYGYTRRSQYEQAQRTIKERALAWTAVPQKYHDHVRAGFGVWLDNDWRSHGWNETDLSKNFFSPQAFADSVRAALSVSDRYVWIYSEQPRWWSGDKLPRAYVQALAAVHAEIEKGKPPP